MLTTLNVEKFFVNTLLLVSTIGVALILTANLLFFPEDVVTLAISASMLSACIVAYSIRKRYATLSVLMMTSMALITMSYQRLFVPNSVTTLAVVLIVGFIFSVMLKGRTMWIMHGVSILLLNTVFVWNSSEAVTAAITYSTLYGILTYATGFLKRSYDRIYQELQEANRELQEKADEIETQNEELRQVQDNLSVVNANLERMVFERTAQIQTQNEKLIRYGYANAHQLRAPLARILGLASVYRLEAGQDPHFFISKIVEEAEELDNVVRQISTDLESDSVN